MNKILLKISGFIRSNTIQLEKLRNTKVRLVAKGFTQKYEFDYEETFALVKKMPIVRLIIGLLVA